MEHQQPSNIKPPKERLHPTSIRLDSIRKAFVEAARGGMSESDYIRWLIDKEMSNATGSEPPRGQQRRRRAPVKDNAQIAQALALLGQSRLFSNLNQIAAHLNQGAHVASGETEAEILSELSLTRQLRGHLLAALGKGVAP